MARAQRRPLRPVAATKKAAPADRCGYRVADIGGVSPRSGFGVSRSPERADGQPARVAHRSVRAAARHRGAGSVAPRPAHPCHAPGPRGRSPPSTASMKLTSCRHWSKARASPATLRNHHSGAGLTGNGGNAAATAAATDATRQLPTRPISAAARTGRAGRRPSAHHRARARPPRCAPPPAGGSASRHRRWWTSAAAKGLSAG